MLSTDKTVLERIWETFGKWHRFTTDSRKVEQHSVFFALKGENFDGNTFAARALELGADIVVMDNAEYKADERCILVDSTLKCMQDFATFYRRKFTVPFIGISGTNGKTTTKELMHAVLSRKYKTHATSGNYNNQLGVPITLLSMPVDTEIAIIEMGASHLHDIDELCMIAEPTHALLTNVGTAHIAGFGSKEGVLQTKTELYRYVDKKEGAVFVNYDDENLRKQPLKHPVRYSLKEKADSSAVIYDTHSPYANIEYHGERIASHLTGSFNAWNMLAAATVGTFFGVEDRDIKSALENYIPSNHRSEVKKTERNTLVLDCYNANPSSCEKALEAFASLEADDKRVFIGSMKELGDVSRDEHRRISEIIKSMHLTQAIFVGEEYREFAVGENILWFASSSEAKAFLKANPVNGSLILVKGSRSTQMEVLTDAL